MKTLNTVLASAALLAVSSAAQATTIQWDFFGNYGSGNTNIGSSVTWQDTTADSMYDIGIDGYTSQWTTAGDLLENNRGTNERGLGIDSNLPEVEGTEGIRIDLGTTTNSLVDWQIAFNSVDGQERALLFTSDTSDCSGTCTNIAKVTAGAYGSNDSYTHVLSGVQRYLFVMEDLTYGTTSDDILLHSLKAKVPAPAPLALLGLGLIGFYVAGRKKSA